MISDGWGIIDDVMHRFDAFFLFIEVFYFYSFAYLMCDFSVFHHPVPSESPAGHASAHDQSREWFQAHRWAVKRGARMQEPHAAAFHA